MTEQERTEIFAKEILIIEDLQKLLCCGYTSAASQMRCIKHKSNRLDISGMCHIQDYIDALGLDVTRYLMPKRERPYEISEPSNKTEKATN